MLTLPKFPMPIQPFRNRSNAFHLVHTCDREWERVEARTILISRVIANAHPPACGKCPSNVDSARLNTKNVSVL